MQLKEMRGTLYHDLFLESTGDATSTGNLHSWYPPLDCQITAISIIPSAAVTANGTNYAIYTATRHTLGASATTVATRSWAAINSVALTAEAMTLSGTAANLLLTADDTLTVIKTVAGTGLIIPTMGIRIAYRLTGI